MEDKSGGSKVVLCTPRHPDIFGPAEHFKNRKPVIFLNVKGFRHDKKENSFAFGPHNA